MPSFVLFAPTVIPLFADKLATMRYEILRRFNIPKPPVGGLLCSVIVGGASLFDLRVTFNLAVRDSRLL